MSLYFFFCVLWAYFVVTDGMSTNKFHGKPAEVEFDGITYSSTPLLNKDDFISEWAIFKRALLQERDEIMKSKSLEKAPEFQEVLELKRSAAYTGIFSDV